MVSSNHLAVPVWKWRPRRRGRPAGPVLAAAAAVWLWGHHSARVLPPRPDTLPQAQGISKSIKWEEYGPLCPGGVLKGETQQAEDLGKCQLRRPRREGAHWAWFSVSPAQPSQHTASATPGPGPASFARVPLICLLLHNPATGQVSSQHSPSWKQELWVHCIRGHQSHHCLRPGILPGVCPFKSHAAEKRYTHPPESLKSFLLPLPCL